MGSKKVTLKSSDGVVFEVEEAVALESEVIKHMIEDNCANDVIPLPNVTSKILSKVIEYCKKLVELEKPGEDNYPSDEDRKSWVADFVKVDGPTLLHLQTAADYLDITGLKELTLLVVGDMINGKTPNEICKTFDIEIPYCFPEPEEEEEEEVTIKAEKVGLNKVTLKSSDGQVFEVKVAVALESQTIMKHMIEVESVDADGAILLPNITSNILSMMIEYCEKHVEMQKRGDNEDWDDRIWEKRGDWVEWHLRFWDENFMLVNQTAYHDLLEAALYLKIKSLLDLTLETAVGVVKSFMAEEEEEEERRLLALMHF